MELDSYTSMNKQIQHNSPTRGWVPCQAKSRACRFKGEESHRTIEVSENLNDHSSAVQAAAADGKIDASERAELSKGIADSIFNKKPKTALPYNGITQPKLKPRVEFPYVEYSDYALEDYEPGLLPARLKYGLSVEETNHNYKMLQAKHSILSETIGMKMANTDTGFEDSWNDFSKGNETVEEKNSARALHRRNAAKIANRLAETEVTSLRQFATAEKNYKESLEKTSKAKAEYDAAKKSVGGSISLNSAPKDYFDSRDAFTDRGTTISGHNDLVNQLRKDDSKTEAEKSALVNEYRTEMVRNAVHDYKSRSQPTLSDDIGASIGRMFSGRPVILPESALKAEIAQAKHDGPAVAKFARSLQAAPWKTFIGN